MYDVDVCVYTYRYQTTKFIYVNINKYTYSLKALAVSNYFVMAKLYWDWYVFPLGGNL